jgi:hypothetical protein
MQRRTRNRVKMVLAVRIAGVDCQGKQFDVLTHTLDISRSGVRVGGLTDLHLRIGSTVSVQRRTSKATFRVAWVGVPGTPRTGHVGLRSVNVAPDFWGLELPLEGEGPVEREWAKTGMQARVS